MEQASITKIIAPVDFSQPSRDALQFAVFLGKTFDAVVEALHVWEAPQSVQTIRSGEAMTRDKVLETTREVAREQLDSLVEEVAPGGQGVLVKPRLEAGTPHQVIVEVARDGGDMVVMGTHGRTGIAHLLLGSVAEKVVRAAPCPVVTVPS